jgi:K+ transporter
MGKLLLFLALRRVLLADRSFQTLFGTALCLADGVFTPAVSVTSAVGGIAIAKPEVSSKVIPISIVSIRSRIQSA